MDLQAQNFRNKRCAQGSCSLTNSYLTLNSREETPVSLKSNDEVLVDESVQVDLSLDTITYDSDDEVMQRRSSIVSRNKKGHPIFSREDIREQYCINRKEVEVLDSFRSVKLLGCFSNPQLSSSCARHSLIFSCINKRSKSHQRCSSNDDNIDRQSLDFENTFCDTNSEFIRAKDVVSTDDRSADEEDAHTSFRKRPKKSADVNQAMWFDSERVALFQVSSRERRQLESSASLGSTSYDESEIDLPRNSQRPSHLSFNSKLQQEGFQPSASVDELSERNGTRGRRIEYCLPRRNAQTPDFLDSRRQKHVSFDNGCLVRSNTVAGGLEDVYGDFSRAQDEMGYIQRNATSPPPRRNHSQERLLDGICSLTDSADIEERPHLKSRSAAYNDKRLQRRLHRALLKTQATQTDLTFKKNFTFPDYLTLSPRATLPRFSQNQKHKSRSLAPLRSSDKVRLLYKSHSERSELVNEESDVEAKEVKLMKKQHRLACRTSTKHQNSVQPTQGMTVDLFTNLSPSEVPLEVLIGDRPLYRSTEKEHRKLSAICRENTSAVQENTVNFLERLNAVEIMVQTCKMDSLPTNVECGKTVEECNVQSECPLSPDSGSSSSLFTDRETSRSEVTTSNSVHLTKSETEDDESSDYVTAIDNSYYSPYENFVFCKDEINEDEDFDFIEILTSPSKSSNYFQANSSTSSSSKHQKVENYSQQVLRPSSTNKQEDTNCINTYMSKSKFRDDSDSSDESTKKETSTPSSASGDEQSPLFICENRTESECTSDIALIFDDSSPEPTSSIQEAQTVIEICSKELSDENRDSSVEVSPNLKNENRKDPHFKVVDVCFPKLLPHRHVECLKEKEGIFSLRLSSSDPMLSESTSTDSTTSGSFVLGNGTYIEKMLNAEATYDVEGIKAKQSCKEQELNEMKANSINVRKNGSRTEKEALKKHNHIKDEYSRKRGAAAKDEAEMVSKQLNIPYDPSPDLFSSLSLAYLKSANWIDKPCEDESCLHSTLSAWCSEGAIQKQKCTEDYHKKKQRYRNRSDPKHMNLLKLLHPEFCAVHSHHNQFHLYSKSRSVDEKLIDEERQKMGRLRRDSSTFCSHCGEKLFNPAFSPRTCDGAFARSFSECAPHLQNMPWKQKAYGELYNGSYQGAEMPCAVASCGINSRLPSLSTEAELFCDEEEDAGVHSESYRSATWIYVSDTEELAVWKCPTEPKDKDEIICHLPLNRSNSVESTSSEHEFLKQYQTVTHRMIHRKSSVEMYKRIANGNFEVDKKVSILRDNGEFGFRIHGSKPVVVSAIEKGTPAEKCGLEVGDIVMTINDMNVLDASHSEVVRLAHTGNEMLTMEISRTCDTLAPVLTDAPPSPVYCGFLQRLSARSNTERRWCRRWFAVKLEGVLYWYRTSQDHQPLGALGLQNKTISRVSEAGAPHAFKVSKFGGCPFYFSADDEDTATRWISALNQVAVTASHADPYVDECLRNSQLPPTSIPNIDCQGQLSKFSQRWKTWHRRYFLLKDASLYFYVDHDAKVASGLFHLHGYKVQSCSVYGQKNAFEAIPPEPRLKHLYFLADTDNEKKRWLAALEYSIDRWIKVG